MFAEISAEKKESTRIESTKVRRDRKKIKAPRIICITLRKFKTRRSKKAAVVCRVSSSKCRQKVLNFKRNRHDEKRIEWKNIKSIYIISESSSEQR